MSDLEHEWVFVIVTTERTRREVERFLEGQPKILRRVDPADGEVVRSSTLMCAVCRLVPESEAELDSGCPGERA